MDGNLITSLDLIGTLKPGYTLNIHPLSVVPVGKWTSLMRRWQGENRLLTLKYLQNLISTTLEFINHQLDLHLHLRKAQEGISNLKTTYQDDPEMVEKLQKLVDDISSALIKFDRWMDITFEEIPKVIQPTLLRTHLDSPQIYQTPMGMIFMLASPITLAFDPITISMGRTPRQITPSATTPAKVSTPKQSITPPSSPLPNALNNESSDAPDPPMGHLIKSIERQPTEKETFDLFENLFRPRQLTSFNSSILNPLAAWNPYHFTYFTSTNNEVSSMDQSLIGDVD